MGRGKRKQAPGQKGNARLFQRGGDIAGTHFVSSLEISYPELVSVFGDPDLIDTVPGRPIGAEWVISGRDGVIAAIYDWERTPGISYKEVRLWHIGGYGPEAAELVQAAISAYEEVLLAPATIRPRSRNSLLAS